MAFQWVWRVRVLGWRFKFFSRDSLIIKVSQYIKRFMVSLQVWPPGSIFEVLPHDPHVVFGGFERFWGLGGSIGVRLQCLGSQKNGNLSLNGMQTKNKFLVTPNFHRTLRVQGVLWSEKTILTPFSAHNNPWCKKQNFKNLLPSMKSINGSQIKGAPYPEIRVRPIFKLGLIFLQ
jgi:hypothetical protein